MIRHRFRSRLLWILVLASIWIFALKVWVNRPKLVNSNINPVSVKCSECYQFTNATRIELLDDILDSDKQPEKGRGIFLLETSCSKDGFIHLNPRYTYFEFWDKEQFNCKMVHWWFPFRQACAIESAARQNRHRDVFILFAAPVGYDLENEKSLSPVVDALLDCPNVHFNNVNLTRFFDNPLVYDFVFKENKLFTANFGKYQVSNLLRLMVLYKYGGVYIDSDFIIKQAFPEEEPTFFAAEESDSIGNSVIGFGSDGPGRYLARSLIR